VARVGATPVFVNALMHVRELRATHSLMPWNGRKLFRIHSLLSLRGAYISVIWYLAPFAEEVPGELNVATHMKFNILDLLFNKTLFFRKFLSEFLVVLYTYVDRDSCESLPCGWPVDRIPEGWDFPHLSRPALGLTLLPTQCVQGLIPGGKATGVRSWPPIPI